MDLIILISIFVFSLIFYFLKNSKLRFVLLVFVVIYLGFIIGIVICIDSILRLVHEFKFLPSFYDNILWYFSLIFIGLTVVLFGAYYCGWLCPFGAFLEVSNKILHKKVRIDISEKISSRMRYAKYIFLAGIFIYPALTEFLPCDIIFPKASKYCVMCITISKTVYWFLIGIIIFSVLSRRFWCKYLCPFHAFLSILSRISLFKKKLDYARCTNCGKCISNCPMQAITKRENKIFLDSWQCIQCNECSSICEYRAV